MCGVGEGAEEGGKKSITEWGSVETQLVSTLLMVIVSHYDTRGIHSQDRSPQHKKPNLEWLHYIFNVLKRKWWCELGLCSMNFIFLHPIVLPQKARGTDLGISSMSKRFPRTFYSSTGQARQLCCDHAGKRKGPQLSTWLRICSLEETGCSEMYLLLWDRNSPSLSPTYSIGASKELELLFVLHCIIQPRSNNRI